MPIAVKGIFPRNKVSPDFVQVRVRRWLERVVKEFREEMQEYPPIQRRSSRRGYRRTFKYRRGWQGRGQFTQDSVTLANPVHYAARVGGSRRAKVGPHQSPDMRIRGWKSITNVGQNVVRRNRRRLQRSLIPFRNVTGL